MKELAQDFKSERLKQGLSLSDIAQRIGIGNSLLKALEAGQFSEIGPPALIHSLFTAYSSALGNNQPSSLDEPEPQPAVNAPLPLDPPQEVHAPCSSREKSSVGIFSLLFLALVTLGGFYRAGVVSWGTLHQSPPQLWDSKLMPGSHLPSETPLDATAIQEPDAGEEVPSTSAENQTRPGLVSLQPMPRERTDEGTISTISTESTSDREAAPSEPASPWHLFEIEAIQPSWVQVKSDHKKTEGALLQPGEKRAWQVAREMLIVVGNAGGVQMTWDGTPVNLGGKPGQVLRFQLPQPDLTGKSP